MTTIKAYDRQPNETESAWLAFCCYRDLTPPRTIEAAAGKYLQAKKGKPRRDGRTNAGHISAWRRKYDWDDRVKAYDLDRVSVVKQNLLDADKEKYLIALENFRQKIETIGSNALTVANISIARIVFELNTINKTTGDKPITKSDWRLFVEGNRVMREALGSAHDAKGLLVEAYGLVETIEDLNRGKS